MLLVGLLGAMVVQVKEDILFARGLLLTVINPTRYPSTHNFLLSYRVLTLTRKVAHNGGYSNLLIIAECPVAAVQYSMELLR